MYTDEIPESLHGIIITDCIDPNARTRQEVRFKSLFGFTPTFVELTGNLGECGLEAAGQLVDQLDAANLPAFYKAPPAVLIVNEAPRGKNEDKNQHENGVPFCYFKVGENIVLSAYDNRVLSLVYKLGLVSVVNVFDIPKVTASLVNDGVLTQKEAEAINDSQFRSLDFLPMVARELVRGRPLPSEQQILEIPPEFEGLVWLVDNFGNLKLTSLPEDVGFKEGDLVTLDSGQEVRCYPRLADVPTGEFGLTIGSSGYSEYRWLQLVKQKARAADELNLKIGQRVLAGSRA